MLHLNIPITHRLVSDALQRFPASKKACKFRKNLKVGKIYLAWSTHSHDGSWSDSMNQHLPPLRQNNCPPAGHSFMPSFMIGLAENASLINNCNQRRSQRDTHSFVRCLDYISIIHRAMWSGRLAASASACFWLYIHIFHCRSKQRTLLWDQIFVWKIIINVRSISKESWKLYLPQMEKNIFRSIPINRSAVFEPRHLGCRLAVHFTHDPHTLALFNSLILRH